MPSNKNQKTLEKNFKEKNGMTVEEAWEKVKEWNLMGKKDEAIKGCKIIIEHFPNHEARDVLQGYGEHMKVEGRKSKAENKKQSESTPNTGNLGNSQEEVIDEDRLFATIAYAWIFCLIPLFMKKNSAFVMFHARQGVIMTIFITVFDLTVGFLLNTISGFLGFILKVLYISCLAFAAYQAYHGKKWKIPGIYGISQKLPF